MIAQHCHIISKLYTVLCCKILLCVGFLTFLTPIYRCFAVVSYMFPLHNYIQACHYLKPIMCCRKAFISMCFYPERISIHFSDYFVTSFYYICRM